jgi:mRNA-degrading endonuclease toxin of MazEF toxin-antitoxin module
LIFKRFSADSFLAIPLTSKSKAGTWYVPVDMGGTMRTGILSQIRVLDSRRLTARIGSLTKGNFQKVKDKFRQLYNP